jgi:glucosylceramidase
VGVDNGYGISGSTTVDNFAYYLGWNSQNLIVGGLNNWASGVQLFNIAENQYYGPQNGGCNNCKGVVQVDTNTDALSYTVDYYLLTEASSVLDSGATIISTNSSNGLQAVAGLNPDNTTGLYVSNSTANGLTFTVDDGGEGFTYTIPALSVASFRWSN